jgi:Uma2 family endonuclease
MATADLPRRPAPTPPPARDPSPRLWTPDEFARMQQMRLFGDRDVFLDAGTAMERHTDGPRPFVFTRPEYYALWDAGFFHTPFLHQRVQLIRGVIELESPMDPPHATSLRKVTRALGRVFGDGYDIRPQLPVDLGLAIEPHPDVAVVTGSIEDYATKHPTTALLVVEVADSTVFNDLTNKAELYAEAGIKDYWVVDIAGRKLHVLRDPSPHPANGHSYRSQTELGADDVVSPLAAPDARIPVAELLP